MPQVAKPSSAKPETAETPAPVKHGSKLLLIILLIAVLLLILAVVVVGALVMIKKSSGGNSGAESAPPPAVAPAPVSYNSAIDLNKPPIFVQLESFTVNLRTGEGEESHYLQTDIALRVNEQKTAEALKGWMPEIRNRINLILTSKSMFDMQNDLSHAKVQNEILRELNAMFGVPPPPPEVPQTGSPLGPVQGVLFISFIVQ